MLIALVACVIWLCVWLLALGTVQLSLQLRTKALYARARLGLGVMPLCQVVLDESAKPPLAITVMGVCVKAGKKGLSPAKEAKTGRGIKNTGGMRRAITRAAIRLYRRCVVDDFKARIDIGLADDAAATALLCAAVYAIAGLGTPKLRRAEDFGQLQIVPHFGQDTLIARASCIISIRARHIIYEGFNLIKEAYKWARTL